MDPATIAAVAAGTVTALVPYLADKVSGKLIEKATEEGFEKRAKIWETVKGLFIGEDLTTLDLFAENPEDVEKQAEIRGELKHLLKANPEITEELKELVKQIKTASNKTSFNYQQGTENYNIQNSDNAKINRR